MRQKFTKFIIFGGVASLVFVACRDQEKVLTQEGEERLALLLNEVPVAEKVEEPAEVDKADDGATEEPVVKVAPEVLEKAITDGKAAYVTCSACHQATGSGIPGAFPPLAKSNWVNNLSNEELSKIVLFGLMGEIEVSGVVYNGVMAPLGAMMTDQQIADVLTYVKNDWGNDGGYVSVDEVKAVREGNPGQGILKPEDIKTLK